MISISLQYLFNLAPRLEPLGALTMEATKLKDVWSKLMTGQQALLDLYAGPSLYSPYLRMSRPLADSLMNIIHAELGNAEDPDREIPSFGLFSITSAYSDFKVAFLAELHSFPAYFVTQKGSHDTYSLLMSGESIFPAEMPTKVPESVFDAKEAGKCLAFEMPTSCGFHVVRVVEAVIRRFFDEVMGSTARPKARNLGVYISSMERSGNVDLKILASLRQIKDLHRNPVMHPEAVLTTEEALALLGISQSAISAMLAHLPAALSTTSNVASS